MLSLVPIAFQGKNQSTIKNNSDHSYQHFQANFSIFTDSPNLLDRTTVTAQYLFPLPLHLESAFLHCTAAMVDYSKKTVAELTEILKSRSLSHSGKKADLVARLNEADKAAEENGTLYCGQQNYCRKGEIAVTFLSFCFNATS